MKLITAILTTCLLLCVPAFAATAEKPNIVYILCDDLGYGDVKCLGGERSKIATPNLDRLAGGGMIFTEAHSSSAVCTPTRYGILTGRYNWRSTLQKGVIYSYAPPLIDKNRLTVASLLKQNGYATACIGKWHVGMTVDKTDQHAPIKDGPTTRGFDYYYGVYGSMDNQPIGLIENNKCLEEATTWKNYQKNNAVKVLPALTSKAVEYIGQQAKEKAPFFLYLALNSPHLPIVPTKEWVGKSGLGLYGDFVMQTDWSVGQVMEALEKAGIANNTLLIFTSDNGFSPQANAKALEEKGHFPSEFRRGYKADIWDGGHRIPFIARWPGKIKAGGRTDQIICLTDLMATSAEIVGTKLPDNAGEDSVSILPVLLGTATEPVREAVVHHSIRGNFAIRQGQWKLELCKGSGGWSKGGITDEPGQLYDMSKDVGERKNEYNEHPEIVSRLIKLLEKYVADGRSTPGPALKNDVSVDIWKKAASHDDGHKKPTKQIETDQAD